MLKTLNYFLVDLNQEDGQDYSAVLLPATQCYEANNFVSFCDGSYRDIKCGLEFVFTPFFGFGILSQCCHNSPGPTLNIEYEAYHSLNCN